MVLWALAGACGSEPPGEPPALRAQLGTGTLEFAPLEDGQPLLLERGPQGGHHFVVHARMIGMPPGDPADPAARGNPVTRFGAFDGGGEQVDLGLPPYTLGYVEDQDGWYALPSGRLLRINDLDVPRLAGTLVRLRLRIMVDNQLADDEVQILVEGDEPAEPADAGNPDASASGAP